MLEDTALPEGGAPAMRLQRIILDAPTRAAPLYWRRDTAAASTEPAAGETLDLDTYFNSFDEMFWRRNCTVGDIHAELEVTGAAAVELWRRTPDGRRELVAETTTDDEADDASPARLVLRVPALAHPRGAGRLALRVKALGPDVRVGGGCWMGTGAPNRIGLAVVICTHNRADQLRRLLARIGDDAPAIAALALLVVVNNGAPLPPDLVPPSLAAVVRVIDQENAGGAGGFSRGLLAAKDAGGVTHAVLMDDDVEIEPDILVRARAIFATARKRFLLGGHMLDLFRPTVLYEAGAVVDEQRLALHPQLHNHDLAWPGGLDAFLDPPAMHYCGWWFLGLELALLDAHGWPMPCFIRGDDVEWGLRLGRAGVDTVSLPGLGIWHEPFTAKLGSWHLYYEVRNMMALASWHQPVRPRRLAELVGRWLVADLLTFRYGRAALILRAATDFLRGPEIFEADPRALHAELLATERAWLAQARVERSRPLPHLHPIRGPRGIASFGAQLATALASEWCRPDRARPRALRIVPHDHLWFRVRGVDAVAVSEPWEQDNPFYTRSRATFRALAARSVALGRRLVAELDEVGARWRAKLPEMTTEQAWRARLGVGGERNRPVSSSIPEHPGSSRDRVLQTAPLNPAQGLP